MHASIHGTIGQTTNMVEKSHIMMLICVLIYMWIVWCYWNNAHTLLTIMLHSYRSTEHITVKPAIGVGIY